MSTADAMGLTIEAARFYEQEFVPAIFGQWPPVLLDAAKVEAGDRLLDVGCGTGVLARQAADMVGLDGQVTGLDLSDSMLSVARNVRPDIAWSQGDVSDLPFDDASFDVVTSPFMLMFVSDPAAAVKEMWRVLAPGGRLAISVWEAIDQNPVYRGLAEIAARRISEEAGSSLAWPFTLGEGGKLQEICLHAGVDAARIELKEGRVRFPSMDRFIRTEIKAWLLADAIGEDSIQAIIEDSEQRFREYCGPQGQVEFPLNAHIGRATKD